jgi:hypothetical protein
VPAAKPKPLTALSAEQQLPNAKLKEEIERQCDGVSDLVREAEAGHAPEVVAQAKALAARQPVLIAMAKRAVDTGGSPQSQSKMREAAKELEDGFPGLIAATKSVLQDPHSEEKCEVLEAKAKTMAGALAQLGDAATMPPPPLPPRPVESAAPAQPATKSRFDGRKADISRPIALVQSASDAKEVLDDLRRAAAAGDTEKAKRAAADLSALRPHVIRDATAMAESTRDPGARKNALSDVRALEAALPLAETSPAAAVAAIDAVVADTKAVPLADVEVARRELEKLEEVCR